LKGRDKFAINMDAVMVKQEDGSMVETLPPERINRKGRRLARKKQGKLMRRALTLEEQKRTAAVRKLASMTPDEIEARFETVDPAMAETFRQWRAGNDVAPPADDVVISVDKDQLPDLEKAVDKARALKDDPTTNTGIVLATEGDLKTLEKAGLAEQFAAEQQVLRKVA